MTDVQRRLKGPCAKDHLLVLEARNKHAPEVDAHHVQRHNAYDGFRQRLPVSAARHYEVWSATDSAHLTPATARTTNALVHTIILVSRSARTSRNRPGRNRRTLRA